MTAELEHSINPLTRAARNNFAVNTLILHRHPEGRLLRLKSPSMERALDSQKTESMRKMMLMQEQVFKQQVQELHRLYNLQKKLMQEIENGLKLGAEMGSSMKGRRDENDGSNSAENSRGAIKFDLEMPAETESTPSSSIHPFEENQNRLGNVEEEEEEGDVEVELTLSIGHCTRKQRSKSHSTTQLQDSDQEHGSSSTKTDHKGDAYGQPNSVQACINKIHGRIG